ncbi:pol [Symbiodinium natans]|uniref:Pol protein n=1 Tax=Symbiodinium natans TaxID=878477 RepID=A0A812NZZ4_9DINO|nr:pol [Symbiodinium natans]
MCTRLEAAGVVYTLLNVYQKALDHKPGTQAERDAVWDALRQELTHCPKRHELIIAGDFNTGLQARSPEVGSAVHRAGQAAKAKDQVTMQQLLRQFDLRALNTFHPYPLHTTYRHDQADKIKSQVDYILVRGGSKHWPILASIPAKYFHAAPPPRERPRQAGGHEGHVSKTVTLIYQEQVQRHIEKLNEWDTEVVNDILHRTAESTILLLPTPKEPAEARPAPVKRMWQCHHDIKQLQRQGPGNEDRVLALKQEFKDLQKQIRNHSQTKRKHYLEERVKLATAAAERGDARALHQQIKRLTPKVPKSKVHLRGKEGQLLSTAQELRLISTYWQNLYTGETITRPITSQAIQITMEEACKAIASLPSHKALPKHYTSSEAWKLAASPLATLLHRTILAQWQAGVITIPQEWKDAWLCLLLKPGKSGRSPDEYRPIGLTDPIGKALLGAIANKHQQTYYQSLHSLPQFAYLPGRGTAQAIARVGQHIHEVKNLVSGQKLTLHHRHAGERQQDLVGGIIVSLDMTKAFDRLEPQHMQNALAASKLPDEVQTLILEWHQGVTYHICHERQDAEIRCSRGIRQGCKIAPRVWALFTALLMHKLGEDWCRDNTTWFADDILFHLQFSNRSELLASIKAIAFALQVIEDLGMQIAAGKSAVLLHLGGAHSRRMRKSLIVMHENKPHLAFQHQARVWHLPLVDKHDYLGIVLSYTRLEEHTATRRINSAQAAFAKLKPVLTHKRMPLELRIRLWKTCVLASLYYGLPQVGLTPHTVRRITVLVHKQLRHITSMPVHLTHISNQDLRDRHGVSQPIAHITAIAQKQLEEAMAVKHDLEADDARIHSLVLKKEKRVAGLLATLMQAESAQQAEDLMAMNNGSKLTGMRMVVKDVTYLHGCPYCQPLLLSQSCPDFPSHFGTVLAILGPIMPTLRELEEHPAKRPRPDPREAQPAKGKGKGKGKKSSSRHGTWYKGHGKSSYTGVGPAMEAMARLCLRQEAELSELRQEKGFILHLETASHGILSPIVQASMKWNELYEQGKADCNLRTCLFRLLLKETAARPEKFEATQESIGAAVKQKWVTENPLQWTYNRWNPDSKKAEIEETKKPLAHVDVKQLLTTMDEALKQDPEALHQFKALRKLTEEMQGSSVAFKISVGLRGAQCQRLYQAFVVLSGLSALNLIGANLHKERQKNSREAALGLPQPVLIANMLAFQTVLRGWANPKMQHDVAEFLHHIVRASNMPYGWGRWEVRRHIHDALTVVDSGCLRAPIAIAMPNAPTHLTTCLRQHFIGDSTQLALVDAPDMLCCQLFRYTVSAEGMTSKNEIRVDYDRQPILIPQWSDMHSLQTCNIPYQITAVALHAGHTPHCGHYRAHLLEDCANLIADDDVVRLCTAQDEHDVQTTSYVFFLRRLSNATGSIDAAPTIEL